MLTPHQPDNLKLGFVGLGDHAFEQLLPAIKITSGFELTALSSRTPDKLEKFANQFQPKFTTDTWQDLLDTNIIDGIVVSASPQLHYEIAKECIVRGIHCFVEKPPTQNITQLKELIELKKTSASKTFVGFNFTFSDAYNKLTQTLSGSPIMLAKFRFLTAKPNQASDGFETLLETCLYKMFIHPAHTMLDTLGEVADISINQTLLDNNKFAMNINLNFASGAMGVIELGNYSNRFECKFELTNQNGETGVLDNMSHFEFYNLQKHQFDNNFKGKEKLVFDYSPILGGFQRTGYQKEFELWQKAIQNNQLSPSELEKALPVYNLIEKVKSESKIKL